MIHDNENDHGNMTDRDTEDRMIQLLKRQMFMSASLILLLSLLFLTQFLKRETLLPIPIYTSLYLLVRYFIGIYICTCCYSFICIYSFRSLYIHVSWNISVSTAVSVFIIHSVIPFICLSLPENNHRKTIIIGLKIVWIS